MKNQKKIDIFFIWHLHCQYCHTHIFCSGAYIFHRGSGSVLTHSTESTLITGWSSCSPRQSNIPEEWCDSSSTRISFYYNCPNLDSEAFFRRRHVALRNAQVIMMTYSTWRLNLAGLTPARVRVLLGRVKRTEVLLMWSPTRVLLLLKALNGLYLYNSKFFRIHPFTQRFSLSHTPFTHPQHSHKELG